MIQAWPAIQPCRAGAPAAAGAAGGRPAFPPPEPLEATAPAVPAEPNLPLRAPEPRFAARVPAPLPDRPLPARRRVIFFDVENTSRAEHIARMIDHLAIDRMGRRTDFVAVGNWRVIGADTARLLARHGAQLVHSAPSAGVKDWSDLRIAVSAGVWLAAARPGDLLEIVTEDRAFDAVGDVAAALGIAFHRLSYRTLAGSPVTAVVEAETPALLASGGRGTAEGRRGRGRGRGGGVRAQAAVPAPRRHEPSRHEPARHEVARHDASAASAHTAPHDEIVGVVRELVHRTSDGEVLIDTLANALKARGFRRPPGSPRLITRLRRIKELSVSPTGMIRLLEGAEGDGGQPEAVEATPSSAGEPQEAATPGRRRRRSRRGGRRRRRPGPAPATPV